MPNWTRNALVAPKRVIRRYLDFTTDETGVSFDFNKVIEMPAALDIEHQYSNYVDLIWYVSDGCKTDPENWSDNDKRIVDAVFESGFMKGRIMQHYSELADKREILEKEEENRMYNTGRLIYDNVKNHGYADWYDWRVANWGSKWNAVDCSLEPDYAEKSDSEEACVCFSTPWDRPIGIMEEIFRANLDCRISFFWNDGGGRRKHWWRRFKNGRFSSDYEELKTGEYVPETFNE